jgi:hypothetical protein
MYFISLAPGLYVKVFSCLMIQVGQVDTHHAATDPPFPASGLSAARLLAQYQEWHHYRLVFETI